jgi:hypothetical protein
MRGRPRCRSGARLVEQLVVEDARREIELSAHDCPTLVRIISGIAESDTTEDDHEVGDAETLPGPFASAPM